MKAVIEANQAVIETVRESLLNYSGQFGDRATVSLARHLPHINENTAEGKYIAEQRIRVDVHLANVIAALGDIIHARLVKVLEQEAEAYRQKVIAELCEIAQPDKETSED